MQFKVCLIELLPETWVADKNYFMEAVLTREAYKEFKRFHTNLKIKKLKDKVILVKKWALLAQEVDSSATWASYNNV